MRKDKRGVPTKVTVVEIDEDTEKVMLEYIHGGLELVAPNIIQEALLSRVQEDENNRAWTFDKVLGHRTGDNGKVEVEILWDNGETSWEPLAFMRKEDPITLTNYAKDRKLTNQRGWKWAKKLAKKEKKLIRMLKLMKASNKSYKKKNFGKRYKFGVELPNTGDIKSARRLDEEAGNTLWFDA